MDCITPNNANHDLNKMGEVKFWTHIIKDGLEKAMEGDFKQMRKNWNWIFGRQDYINSFDSGCELIGVNPSNIKKKFLQQFLLNMKQDNLDQQRIWNRYKTKVRSYL